MESALNYLNYSNFEEVSSFEVAGWIVIRSQSGFTVFRLVYHS